MVVTMRLPGFSRLQVFGTCVLFFLAEIIAFSFCYALCHGAEVAHAGTHYAQPTPTHAYALYIVDFLLVTLIFFMVNYLKRGTLDLSPEYQILLLIIYGLWFVTGIMTRKFSTDFRNYYYAMAQWAKAVIFMAATMAVLIFAFRLFYYSRLQVFGFFLLLILSEAMVYFMYYVNRLNGKNGGDVESVGEIKAVIRQKKLSLDIDFDGLRSLLAKPVRDKLRELYRDDSPEVFDLLDRTLDLSGIIRAESAIINRGELSHQKTTDPPHIRLLINLERVNNIRWINRFFWRYTGYWSPAVIWLAGSIL